MPTSMDIEKFCSRCRKWRKHYWSQGSGSMVLKCLKCGREYSYPKSEDKG